MADIKSYYPDILKEVREFQMLAAAENPEIELLSNALADGMDQQFIRTAKKHGIARLEKMIGIIPKAADTLDERKFKLLAKYNENVPYTVPKLEEMLTTLCGADGYSLEIDNSSFTLRVKVELTSKKNRSTVVELAERIVPVNMVVIVELMYNQWQMVTGFSWNDGSAKTWGQLREEVINVG